MSRIYERNCTECNILFRAKYSGGKYCSPECKKKGRKRNDEAYRQKKAEEATSAKLVIKKPNAAEIDAAARRAGMSYGHYVALHNL